jgi:carbon monoxide dehydrogenase subunit G
MEIRGSYVFDAPQERVWALLMDPAAISACLPGCERFEPAGDNRYEVTLTIGLAAITGTYQGSVVMAEQVEPRSYVLRVEGQGRAGFVRGDTRITLSPAAEGATTVDVAGSADVGGAIARVGQRLIGGASKMMMDKFFNCLRARL